MSVLRVRCECAVSVPVSVLRVRCECAMSARYECAECMHTHYHAASPFLYPHVHLFRVPLSSIRCRIMVCIQFAHCTCVAMRLIYNKV